MPQTVTLISKAYDAGPAHPAPIIPPAEGVTFVFKVIQGDMVVIGDDLPQVGYGRGILLRPQDPPLVIFVPSYADPAGILWSCMAPKVAAEETQRPVLAVWYSVGPPL